MDREVYYENNNVLDMKDYKRMIDSIQNTPENRLAKQAISERYILITRLTIWKKNWTHRPLIKMFTAL